MRKIDRIIDSQIAPVGTFSVRRALPDHARKSVGPWVFLDHFGPFRVKPGEDGVGPHPHAGIETVTYLLSGRNEHRDSAGHTGIVGPGGAQWMTSGRGIIHAEAPVVENSTGNEADMTMHGIQLWTSLPRALKLMPPRYQRIDAAAIPDVALSNGRVKVIAGGYASRTGPAQTLMPLLLWHVSLDPLAEFRSGIPAGFEVAAYVIAGAAGFGGRQRAATGQLVVFDNADGDIEFSNVGESTLDVLLLGGPPAEGPLVFHGPFVMNSLEQVRRAERAYHGGQMGSLA
ncbi:MAG: pirin family protein [Betaproteobacteria bacterium]